MTDYERLRGLAENATPGPWQYNAEFIAAADPDAVLNLLEDLRISREERDTERRKRAQTAKDHDAEIRRWEELTQRLRDKGAALTKDVQYLYAELVRKADEIDKLKVENAALRRGQGTAPAAREPGPINLTPIPDSRRTP